MLPYLATSTATVLCAFEYNNAAHMGGMGYFLSEKNAELFLHVLEPLQVGYGAVVCSNSNLAAFRPGRLRRP